MGVAPLLVAVGIAVAPPAQGAADEPGAASNRGKTLRPPSDLDVPPPGRRLSGREVAALADAVPLVVEERRKYKGAKRSVVLRENGRWQVSYFTSTGAGGPLDREITRVVVDDATGGVVEAFKEPQVRWPLARGTQGPFGHTVTHPAVWLGFCLAFALPFLRGPLRMLHLDLAALLGFSISLAWFNAARIDISAAVATALMVYLLVRMLLVARGRSRAGLEDTAAPLALRLPVRMLVAGVVVLAGLRIGFNLVQYGVFDVGYNGVIGADRFTHGRPPWGTFPQVGPNAAPLGDTYGPLVYLSYIPFELIFPWSGKYDELLAAHAAAICFDLSCIVMLYLVGRRLRGHALGVLLAYAWCAFPFTLLVLSASTNDALVSLTLLGAMFAIGSPVRRGAWLGAATMAKMGPLALLPVFATCSDQIDAKHRAITAARTAAGATAVIAVLLVPVVVFGDLATFWDRVIGVQASFDSPFSIWGSFEALAGRQWIAEAATVLLGLAVAVVPRRRDPVVVAALAAAVLLALHVARTYWLYTYLIWWLPLVLVALLAPLMPREPAGASSGADAGTRPGA